MNEDFNVVQMNENTWYFDGPVGRAFLFKGKTKALLVDTTMGPGNLKDAVTNLVGDLPIVLVNTHGDSDHIGCNEQFENAYMNPSEFAYYATKCKKGDAKPLPLSEGEVIDIGDRQFEVIYTPGHTYGSIVLLNRKERILVGGDSILEIVFIFGPQRNLRALIYSLEKLRDNYYDDFDQILTAHYDCPMDKSFIFDELSSAEALLAGEIVGVDPGEIPLEGPDFKPAALYKKGKSGFFDYETLEY